MQRCLLEAVKFAPARRFGVLHRTLAVGFWYLGRLGTFDCRSEGLYDHLKQPRRGLGNFNVSEAAARSEAIHAIRRPAARADYIAAIPANIDLVTDAGNRIRNTMLGSSEVEMVAVRCSHSNGRCVLPINLPQTSKIFNAFAFIQINNENIGRSTRRDSIVQFGFAKKCFLIMSRFLLAALTPVLTAGFLPPSTTGSTAQSRLTIARMNLSFAQAWKIFLVAIISSSYQLI